MRPKTMTSHENTSYTIQTLNNSIANARVAIIYAHANGMLMVSARWTEPREARGDNINSYIIKSCASFDTLSGGVNKFRADLIVANARGTNLCAIDRKINKLYLFCFFWCLDNFL